jgi:putative transposase
LTEKNPPQAAVALALAQGIDDPLNLLYKFTVETTKKGKLAYQRDEHRVHLIVYHLIWCPKRRKPILVGKLKDRCQELIEAKCKEKGWTILTLAIQPEYIHLFVRVWPSDSASDVVKELKGYASFFLRKEFHPMLSKLPSLWTRSYFSSTAGAVSAQTIQDYLDAKTGV